MPKKFDECVKSVKMDNRGKPKRKKVNPYAVCNAAIGGRKKNMADHNPKGKKK